MPVSTNYRAAGGRGRAEALSLAELLDVPATGIVPPASLGTGSGITTKFLRGDGTWQTVAVSGAPDDAKYLTLAADGDLSAEVIQREPFQARMQRDSTTQISLQRFKGTLIVVNGEAVDPGAAGFTRGVADNLIAGDGTDSGGNCAPSTLYYVYVSNASASFSPSGIRMSTTAPSLLNGVKYLATSGNGANWRFVGWVRTNATGTDGEISDDTTDRLVINYYNRRKLPIILQPGYNDNNAATTYSYNNASYARINGGTGDTGSYITNGEDPIEFHINAVYASVANKTLVMSFGDNSNTEPTVFVRLDTDMTGFVHTASGDLKYTPAEGYRTISLLAFSDAAFTVYADLGRAGGSAADKPGTRLFGAVKG